MSFLTILFALLGLQGDAPTDQGGAGGDAQGGTGTELGGMIIVNG